MRRKERSDPRLRVVQVVATLNMGGAEKLLVDFARHLDRTRFALRFLCLTGRGSLADEVEAAGWPVTVLDWPRWFRAQALLRLARLFRQWQSDVVHTHNTMPFLYACPAARLARVPRVVHTRHGQRFQAPWRETFAFGVLSRLTDRVVCVSHDSARLSVDEGVAPGRVATIWNGIDVSCFSYAGPAAGGPAVMVGRLNPEKDVRTLIRAAALAARAYPNFRLEIAGDGPCLGDLRRLTGELGLGGHVHFLGEVRDVPRLLSRAGLLVLPSLTEGVSLTLLEAMGRGLPVVATRVGGNPEVVVDGETGLLVSAWAPADLAAAMVRLLRSPEESRRMGWAGRQRAERHFDARRMVADYESLYAALLAPRGRAPDQEGGATTDPGPVPEGCSASSSR